ncbi:cation:proton antiporter [Agromyces seonyuensis]|uniref:Cation:proton antiporter n=1 Tax=Agromyces seonyuensis TaxID=2662446 RepID=A0A6I4NSB0_9MICO|nr:cation:proton antiporter [Agromyces seonyuensis]MWB97378.1 cation:proton antiporter [Agromyces seonyuensis]
MDDISLPTLVLIPLIAVAAPLLGRLVGRIAPVPLVVFEILLGILCGPSFLGWVEQDDFVEALSNFGLAMLFFLAGNEIDYPSLGRRALSRAGVGWLISLVAGFGVAFVVAPEWGAAGFIAIALSSTALGTIMPVLKDAGDLGSPFGRGVIAVGAIGEFGPLLAISLFLSGRDPGVAAVVMVAFAIISVLAFWLASRGSGKALHDIIAATLHTSGQFAIRLVILVLVALVGLSIALGLDMLLGAFTAGALYRVLLDGAPREDAKLVEGKLEGLGYGFLVPIFFIYTGVTFDVDALLQSPAILALVPAFAVLLLLTRGLPAMLAAPEGASRRDRIATAFFGATGLPIIVAVTALGVDDGALDSGLASALVGAGMLSVLIYPLLGLGLRRSGTRGLARPETEDAPEEA